MVYSKFLEEIIYTIYVTVQILFLYIILNYLQMIYTVLNENSSINDFIYFVNTHYLLLGVFLKENIMSPCLKTTLDFIFGHQSRGTWENNLSLTCTTGLICNQMLIFSFMLHLILHI